MEIISHRGYWKSEQEKNTMISFERSFSLGFGTETDIRDYNGDLVISHDMPTIDSLRITDFLSEYKNSGCEGTLALNIKSDGLQDKLIAALVGFNIESYFVFDMSIPDSIVSLRYGLNVFSRFSEFESENALWESSDGIWYDNFGNNPINVDFIAKMLSLGRKICIVSDDLHKRDKRNQWALLRTIPIKLFESPNLILCTDYPEEASEYFYGN